MKIETGATMDCKHCGNIQSAVFTLCFETGEEVYKVGCSICKTIYGEFTLDMTTPLHRLEYRYYETDEVFNWTYNILEN